LFSLEEVSYFFPAKTLFRTFFCCICAALTLKFLDPYGNGKIVIFEVRYVTDWEFFELAAFIAVGVLGGVTGAIFIKASRKWAHSFRKIPLVKKWPLAEVMMVALITGLVGYWNPYTKVPVAKLLFNLTSPCNMDKEDEMGLCPENLDEIYPVIRSLGIAFFVKGILTIITFGIVSFNLFSPQHFTASFGNSTNVIKESSSWYICTFYGSGWFRRPSYRPLLPVACPTISNMASMG